MRSLRARLLALWLLSLAAGITIALVLHQLYALSAQAQEAQSAAVIARACDLIRERYAFFTSGPPGQMPEPSDEAWRAGLANVVGVALAHEAGVEGGIWQAAAGPLAYAFPTYEGTGPKTDLPAAERPQIEAVNAEAARDEQAADRRIDGRSQTLLLHACALRGAVPGLTAWTMTRVNAAPGFRPLLVGLGVLALLLLAMALGLGWALFAWTKHVGGIERALAEAGPGRTIALEPTGERELDQIIGALNEAGRRLEAARRQAEQTAERAAQTERLAALGRVAAGVAHEIRNPIAAARLQGENGLAGDDGRRRQAIRDMLAQLVRLDALVAELLAMTQRSTPHPAPTDVAAFARACAGGHAELAEGRHVTVAVETDVGEATFDAAIVGRILDNLLTNAIRHAPAHGRVVLAAEAAGGGLRFSVADDGPGVSAEIAERVFEPFVTGRADGTGLGLAIARELADAHGGRLRHRPGERTIFVLELPCQPS